MTTTSYAPTMQYLPDSYPRHLSHDFSVLWLTCESSCSTLPRYHTHTTNIHSYAHLRWCTKSEHDRHVPSSGVKTICYLRFQPTIAYCCCTCTCCSCPALLSRLHGSSARDTPPLKPVCLTSPPPARWQVAAGMPTPAHHQRPHASCADTKHDVVFSMGGQGSNSHARCSASAAHHRGLQNPSHSTRSSSMLALPLGLLSY